MSKNFSKGLSLVMTMVVLCLANSITAGATDECPHNNIGNLFSAEENYNCELGGIADFFCWDCRKNIEDGYASPREHDWDYDWKENPTCEEDGFISWYCMNCNYGRYTEILPALGHDYSGEWVELLPATCYDRGVKINQCTRCNAIASEVIDRTAHTDADANAICDECSTLLSVTVTPENPDTPDAPDDPDTPGTPETPEQPKEEANIFSFLTQFLTNLLDFFSKLFKLN